MILTTFILTSEVMLEDWVTCAGALRVQRRPVKLLLWSGPSVVLIGVLPSFLKCLTFESDGALTGLGCNSGSVPPTCGIPLLPMHDSACHDVLITDYQQMRGARRCVQNHQRRMRTRRRRPRSMQPSGRSLAAPSSWASSRMRPTGRAWQSCCACTPARTPRS